MKKLEIITTLILLLISAVNADNWETVSETDNAASINSAAVFIGENGELNIVAVGDSGQIYQRERNHSWRRRKQASDSTKLMDIGYYPDQNGPILIAAGSKGTILRSTDKGTNWQNHDQGTEDFNAAAYDQHDGIWLVGGKNNSIFSSNDGTNWGSVMCYVAGLDVIGFLNTGNASPFLLYGIKNDSTFLVEYNENTFGNVTDTIPDFAVSDAYLSEKGTTRTIFLCGTNPTTQKGVIYTKAYNILEYQFSPAVIRNNSLPEGLTSISGYNVFESETVTDSILWTAVNNIILKSTDGGVNWNELSLDLLEGTIIKKIIRTPDERYSIGDYAFAVGSNRLILKNVFEIDYIIPSQNSQFDGSDENNSFTLKFSTQIDNIEALFNTISLHSSAAGEIPFTVTAESPGSYKIERVDSNLIAGEHLNLEIKDSLTAAEARIPKFFPIDNSYDALSLRPAPLDFVPNYTDTTINQLTTNYVAGFFNNDDIFDLITFSNSKIHCFAGNGDGSFRRDTIISVDPNVSVDTLFQSQLLTYDIDGNGKLDLILYDDAHIRIFSNQSTDQSFNFAFKNFDYSGSGIRQVALDNLDFNGQLDLRVLTNNYIFSIPNINFDSTNPDTTARIANDGNYKLMRLGDIDHDGINDLVLTDMLNKTARFRGSLDGRFTSDRKISSGNKIIDLRLMDINRDNSLEIVELGEQNIRVVENIKDTWNFSQPSQTSSENGTIFKQILAQDFGGMEDNNQRLADIAAIDVNHQLFLYENQTVNRAIKISQNPVRIINTNMPLNAVSQGDFDKDGIVDLAAFSKADGAFRTFTKVGGTSWKPHIYSADLDGDAITIKWSSFPSELGNLDYYVLMRDNHGLFNSESDDYHEFIIESDTIYTENTSGSIEDYYYAVYAVFDESKQTMTSDTAIVEKTIKLNGNVSGILDRTDLPYLAKDTIRIASGDTLTIKEEVTIIFYPQAAFKITGNININGDAANDHFVKFTSVDADSSWPGIYISASPDTAHITGFQIQNADSAIVQIGRPLNISDCSFYKNRHALYASGDTISVTNSLFYYNQYPIALGPNSRSFLKNIDAITSSYPGVIIDETAINSIIKNSIFWNNSMDVSDNTTSIKINGTPNVTISYSTSDSIDGAFTDGGGIINTTPLFTDTISGHYYIAEGSPTIDAGDPNDDYSKEPQPNGHRINQGTYGNTLFAAPSPKTPALFFDPNFAYLETKPGIPDTLSITVTNTSSNSVTIDSIKLRDNLPPFSLAYGGTPINLQADDSAKISIIFNPDQKGSYYDSLLVYSNDPIAPSQAIAIEAHGLNTPPVIDKNNELLFAAIEEDFYHQISAHDPDGDTLSYTFSPTYNPPQWLQLSQDGILSGEPTIADTGHIFISVYVNDNSEVERTYLAEIIVVKQEQLLNGAISGTLESQNSPYYVESNIAVNTGETLTIGNNVKLLFLPETRFDIFGNVSANADFDNLIHFTSFNKEPMSWNGIKIYAAGDTIHLKGIQVYNADTALTCSNRPLQISQSLFIANDRGIFFTEDSLLLQNVILDSNTIAIALENNSRSGINNITLVHSSITGIDLLSGSSARISNSILWDNDDNSVVNQNPQENLSINYTTVDVVHGPYLDNHNLNTMPLFMPPDTGLANYMLDINSPTIDAGNPLDDYDLEPSPNGNRINQGAFGGTKYAAQSPPKPSLSFDPPFVELETFVNEADTAVVILRNNSQDSTINISNVHFIDESNPFSFFDISDTTKIAPQDSIIFSIVFMPEYQEFFEDTLTITTNDTVAPVQYLPVSGIVDNRPPVLERNNETLLAVAGEDFSYTIPVYDPDYDMLDYYITEGPEDLDINPSSGELILIFYPTASDTGSYDIVIEISDTYYGEGDKGEGSEGSGETVTYRARMYVVNPAQALDGSVSGTLDSTNSPYIVLNDIYIDPDSSLFIGLGTEIFFAPNTRFDIYGSLHTASAGNFDKMIELKQFNPDSLWTGLRIHPNPTDTVKLAGMVIDHADTALVCDNRPIDIRFSGFTLNNVGLSLNSNRAQLRNILVDSTNMGIIIDRNFADIKNITVTHSRYIGMNITPSSYIKMRNAIFWENGNSIVSGVNASQLNISYSTIDSVYGPYSGKEISKLPPIFNTTTDIPSLIEPASPTVDAGDPADDYSQEPTPNGGRINQGAFGGTELACPTLLKTNLVITPSSVELHAVPQHSDTAKVSAANISAESIDINAVYIKNNTAEFSINGITPVVTIDGGDSIHFNITFSPTEKRLYTDTLVIESSDPLASTQFIPLFGEGLNRPSILTTEQESIFAAAGDHISHKIPAIDPDGDTLVYRIQNTYGWVTVDSINGLISGTIPAAGDYDISISIHEKGSVSYLYYNLYVTAVDSNQVLEGAVSGVLDTLFSPYYVRSDIYVPQGDSLTIKSGAKFRFFPNTRLDIYGSFYSSGDFNNIIEFEPYYGDTTAWKGIKIHQGSDTANIGSIVIFNADTAVTSQNRPLKLSYLAITGSELAVSITDNRSLLENIYISDSKEGMNVNRGNVDIKNITIVNSKAGGLNISAGSSVKLRNGILWDNGTDIISAAGSENLLISYTTLDTISGNYSGNNISRIPPVFEPFQDGFAMIDSSSATIDAGDPKDDYSQEPQPNGGRINQGAFGGTSFAARSLQGNLHVMPEEIELIAYPGERDTAFITLYNGGGSELNILSISLSSDIPEFRVYAQPPYHIPAADSVIIPAEFRPNERRSYSDTLIITSDDPHDVNGLRYVPISGIGLNHAPVVVGNAPERIRVEHHFAYKIEVFDAEQDSISFTAVKLPNWLSLADSGKLQGTPLLSDTGMCHIEVAINDGHGGRTSFIHDLMVWIVDDYIPNVTITVKPESVIKESAAHFEFTADDTSGYLIGDKPELLFKHYRLIRTNDQTLITDVDSTKDHSATIYPLADGDYLFQVWAYDTHGNGIDGKTNRESVQFTITGSKIKLSRMNWHMVAFPRAQTFKLDKINRDSTAIILRWSNEDNGYLPPKNSEITMGEAFWIQSLSAYDIDLTKVVHSSKEDSIYTPIEKGWNQIGIPLGYKVNWSDMAVISDSSSHKTPLIDILESNAVYEYVKNKEFHGYIWEKPDTAAAEPWKGYWIKTSISGTLIFPKEPTVSKPIPDSTQRAQKAALAKMSLSNWQLDLMLSNDQYMDRGNIIGISENGENDIIYEPPHFGNYCSLYFQDAKGVLTQELKAGFENYEDVISWDFFVKSADNGKEHLLRWNNESIKGLSLYLFLVDPENERIVSMNNENLYKFTIRGGAKKFKIYATQDASFSPKIIPLEFKLQQNYPNPFNPATTIRFGIPESMDGQKITIKIYDVLGRVVKTLLNEKMEMGYHKIVWNSRNNADIPAASGIYFYQIKGGDKLLVKKMVLVR